MAEPFDTLAAEQITLLEGLIAGTIDPEDATGDLAQIFEALSLNSGVLEAVKATLGRVRGMFVVSAPPSDFLGVPGSTAIDLTNRIWYGPKDVVTGWPTGVAFIDQGPTGPTGPQGPQGETGDGGDIVEVTIETLAPGANATVTRGGTPGARTLHFGIPRGDTGADTASIVLEVQERVDGYGLALPGQVASFVGRAIEADFVADYVRKGLEIGAAILDLDDVTLTRATGGYGRKADGSYQWFGANVPRQTDWGLTVERASTNIVPRSSPTVAQLNTGTNCSNVSEPSGAPIAGQQWQALDNTAGKTAISYQTLTHSPNAEHRFSVFVHCPDGIAPVPSTSSVSGDFTMIIAGQLALTGIIVERVGTSNFWRCSGSFVTGATPSGSSGLIRYSGQNTRAMSFSIRQMEVGDRATTPIITTGASATRAADELRHVDLAFDAPFILYARFAFMGAPSTIGSGGRTALELSAAGGNNRARLANIGGAVGGQLIAGGTDQGQPVVAGAVAINTPVAVAMLVQPDRLIVARNGSLGTPDTVATMPTVALTRLDIGCGWDGASQLDGVLMELAAIPLPGPAADAPLQTMTS